jgi:hypothetical protein
VSTLEHVTKVLVLVDVIEGFVAEAAIYGQLGPAIRPEQGDEADAPHNALVFAAPMPMHQFHVPGMGFVQGTVVYDEQSRLEAHEGLCLGPQRLGVRRLSCEQAGISIMGRRLVRRSIGLSRFDTTEGGVCRQEKLDVVQIGEFRWSSHIRVCYNLTDLVNRVSPKGKTDGWETGDKSRAEIKLPSDMSKLKTIKIVEDGEDDSWNESFKGTGN